MGAFAKLVVQLLPVKLGKNVCVIISEFELTINLAYYWAAVHNRMDLVAVAFWGCMEYTG